MYIFTRWNIKFWTGHNYKIPEQEHLQLVTEMNFYLVIAPINHLYLAKLNFPLPAPIKILCE